MKQKHFYADLEKKDGRYECWLTCLHCGHRFDATGPELGRHVKECQKLREAVSE